MIVDIWISNGFVVIYDGSKLMRGEHIPPNSLLGCADVTFNFPERQGVGHACRCTG